MTTSFISEHTAEFVLVPELKRLLEEHFISAVPIFPWLSREFGAQSKKSHGALKFHVLVMFPRRPRISKDGEIFVTINPELIGFKEIGAEYGIAVIAGCPCATNFLDLASCKDCVWLNIEGSFSCLLRLESLEIGNRLSESDILRVIREGRSQSIQSLEEFIQATRFVLPQGFFGAKYKPIYFLVFDH